MMKLARTIPKLTFLALLLAALAAPTYASIAYTSCSNGCASSSGTYSAWQSAPGSAGLTFSVSPDTFIAGPNLVGGVYTDPTGTIFTSYNGSNIDTAMSVSGTSLLQGISGNGTGLEILLPANTYAVAFDITTLSGSGFTSLWVALGDHNLSGANYNVIVTSGGNVQFFGIVSTTPLTELFIGPMSFGGRLQLNDFELGEQAPTPELSSVTLMGSGLLLLGFLRRRIHKPNSAVA
jgi:hypothetical protein